MLTTRPPKPFYLTKHASFEESGTEVFFIIVGDKACRLKRKDLFSEERVFNYRLSRARRCIACAFGTLRA
jgi:hypothetical protein